MAFFEFDVTLRVTHTQTIEARNIDAARKIVSWLADEYGFVEDMVEELTTDYELFDSDHITIGEPSQTTFDDVTIDPSDYIGQEWLMANGFDIKEA